MKIILKSGMLLREQPSARSSSDKSTKSQPAVLRVLGIKKDLDHAPHSSVAVIRCDKPAMPYVISLQQLEERIAIGDYLVINESDNPASPGIRCAEDLGDRAADFSKAMEDKIRLIAPVINLGWNAFYLKARGIAIRAIAAGEGNDSRHSKSWVRELLWRFWSGGSLALGPQYHKCGALSRAELLEQARKNKEPVPAMKRPGRSRKNIGEERAGPAYQRGGCYISPKCEAAITSIIDDYFKSEENMSVVRISLERRDAFPWKALRDHVEFKLSELPEFSQVNPSVAQIKWIGSKSTNVIEVRRAAQGSRYVDLNHRAFTGDYRDVTFAAGHRYELDASMTDIHLVDDVSHMVIGRANVIWVVDSYSGMIVGVYVTTQNINFAHVARALHGAFSKKSAWCNLFGLQLSDEDWPCDGRCGHLTADNAQMITKAAESFPEFISDSGICPSYRPDRKGLVEFTAEFSNIGLIHFFHYGVSKGPKERAKEDASKKAVVSVQAFTREIVSWAVNVANHRPLPVDRALDPAFLATGALPTPYNVWKWSVGVHGGPPNAYDSAHWMPRLLERSQATITPHGLEFEAVLFDDLSSDKLQAMKQEASVGKVKHVPIHVDRLTTKQIYLVPDDIAQPPIPVPLSHLSRDYAGKTFDEVALQIGSRKAKHDDAELQYNRRKKKQAKRMQDSVESDKAAVKKKHGSITNRNHAAAGTDLDKVAENQGKADNDKIAAAIHGTPPASPSGSTPNETKNTSTSGARPPCLSS